MATLVFSTVGQVLGGPIGGAIGALIGQSIDQQLMAPRGPKVGDLKVQSSDYGTPVPRIYGTMRVAGSVVWATDLEASADTSGAKGQAGAVTSYRVSFAVAVSSRPASRIGRIWADGKLLRGAAGDFKVPVTFRFYPGSEGQGVDPLIASLEGIDTTPAYRGLALAVFENLELAEYGNRIPFLTFEIVAEEDAPTLGTILEDASDGAIATQSIDSVAGYAAYGATIRAAVSPLVTAFGLDLFDDGEQVREAASGGSPVAVSSEEFGNSADHKAAPRIERELEAARSLPTTLRLTYYDPDRDFQGGEMRASVGDEAGRVDNQDLAAVLPSDDAKTLAHALLARRWAGRDRLTLRLSPGRMDVEPGMRITLPLDPSTWVVDEVAIDAFVVMVTLRPYWKPSVSLASDPGRYLPSRDNAAGPVTLAMIEVADDGTGEAGNGSLMIVAASSPSPGWRSLPVTVQSGNRSLGAVSLPAKGIVGESEGALAPGQSFVRDDINSVIVTLVDPDQSLENRDDSALAEGDNLAILGNEIVQFARAEPLGSGRFALSGLMRGRLGTEWAMAEHQAGETFAMLTPGRFATLRLPRSITGASVAAEGQSLSGQVVSSPVVARGEHCKPMAPISLKGVQTADGGLTISWVRRSRSGLAWVDEGEAPIGETRELYAIEISGVAGTVELESTESTISVSSASVAALGAGLATITVRQIGDWALSRPTMINLTLA